MPRWTDTFRHLAIACGAIALFLGGVWVGVQGGLPLMAPGKLVAVVGIALDSLPTLAALAVAAMGLGLPVRHFLARGSRCPNILQVGGGLAVLLLLDWALAMLGLLNNYTAWAPCLAGAAALGWQGARAGRSLFDIRHWPNPPWTLLAGLPLLGLYLVACACPPGSMWINEARGFDVMAYHLELPREWLALGRMTGLHHNVYSYLPNLVEAGYMQVLALRRATPLAFYTAQFFHAGLAMLAAATLGCMVSRWVGRAAAVAAAVVFLALPWSLITGTLAYDEMAALSFGALALLLLFDPIAQTPRGALLAGLLCGASFLAKPSCGLLIIPPALLIALLRLNRPAPATAAETPVAHGSDSPHPSSHPLSPGRGLAALRPAAFVALGVALILAPYLVRNARWTGNPIFPFAADVLGRGHWSTASAQRWQAVHQPPVYWHESLDHLRDRWLTSTGFGTVGGTPRPLGNPAQESLDIARFDFQGGVPVLWLSALAGGLLLLAWPAVRRLALAMFLMLAVQVATWICFTHQQSRFLLPAALPACILIGLGAGRLQQLTRYRARIAFPATVLSVTIALVITCFVVYLGQTRDRWDPVKQRWLYLPTSTPIASLVREIPKPDLAAGFYQAPGDHVLNSIPDLKGVLLIADTQGLLYLHIRAPLAYNSPFDACILGDLIRQYGDNPGVLARALRQRGFSHLWVNWSELYRLSSTPYGYDPDVTPQRLASLVAHWHMTYYAPPTGHPNVALYSIPDLSP
jgi:4-amino-4-deoxy-L-arabinose transferase-like glycosyltransferase